MSQPSLGRIAGDLVASVQLFESAPEGQRPEASVLRSRLLGALDLFTKHPALHDVAPDELEHARFALVSWADEVCLRTDWPGREEWLRDPLQLQLFRTNRAGDEFFERLERLRPEQHDAREVFLLCLSMGFEGRWAGEEPHRRTLMNQQYEMLRAAGRALEVAAIHPLAPPAYDVEIKLNSGSGRGLPRIALGWAAVALVFFAVTWSVLTCATGDLPLPPAS